MRFTRNHLPIVLLIAGSVACAGTKPWNAAGANPAPVAAQDSQAIAEVTMTAFRWATTNTTKQLRVAFWTNRIGDSVAERLEHELHLMPLQADDNMETCELQRANAPAGATKGFYDFDPLAHLNHCSYDGFDALIAIFRVNTSGNSANAFFSIEYDPESRRAGDRYCLKLTRKDESWSVDRTGNYDGTVGPHMVCR
jgi:hypothetical protein